MKISLKSFTSLCLKYGQLFVCTLMIFCWISIVLLLDTHAQELSASQVRATPLHLKMLRPKFYKNNAKSRAPSNINITLKKARPAGPKKTDDEFSGILKRTKKSLKKWSAQDEYAQIWHLKSTGIYQTPNNKYRKKFAQKGAFRYFSKHLSKKVKTYVKKAKRSPLAKVNNTLESSAQVEMGGKTNLHLNAKVLQGKVSLQLENPYITYKAQYKAKNNSAKMHLKRDIASIGVAANIDYDLGSATWVATAQKSFSHQWTAIISSTQKDKDIAFSSNSEQKYHVLYRLSF